MDIRPVRSLDPTAAGQRLRSGPRRTDRHVPLKGGPGKHSHGSIDTAGSNFQHYTKTFQFITVQNFN